MFNNDDVYAFLLNEYLVLARMLANHVHGKMLNFHVVIHKYYLVLWLVGQIDLTVMKIPEILIQMMLLWIRLKL